MNIIDWILYIPLALCVCYLLLYAIASKFYRAPQYPEARMLRRIAVLFPAYKEDRVILASVESFLKQDYPKELYDVIVISDQMRPETNEAASPSHPSVNGKLHGKFESQSNDTGNGFH